MSQNVQFEESEFGANRKATVPTSSMVNFLIRKGLAKDARKASALLFITALVLLATSVMIFLQQTQEPELPPLPPVPPAAR